ncbi:hypothetical protein [Klenkia sp. PcliD-1-E]|uniref:hypothetical protein n=1 Tax=Klenkia sp. PcliD-1-E TaxID=2954492 RepID=UPI002096CBD6|nr:hypothetical protein [Klenkia sp. PcliD-1-E]MCO7219509.1 hypothetical protein [Klenkia sp. PcliD-1-E]
MQVATLTLTETREVIALTEELLTRTSGETDRMDLHQQLATLYSRMLSAQTRELAQDAGLTRLTRLPHGRCCLLTPNLLDPAVRDLRRLIALGDVDEDLRARCVTALENLHRVPPAGLSSTQ